MSFVHHHHIHFCVLYIELIGYKCIAGGVLGINLTEVPAMLSQGEDFTHFNITQLRNMVSTPSTENLPLITVL